jgi:hypothetical protein
MTMDYDAGTPQTRNVPTRREVDVDSGKSINALLEEGYDAMFGGA